MKIKLKINPTPYDKIQIGGNVYLFGIDIIIGKTLGKTLKKLKDICLYNGIYCYYKKHTEYKRFIFNLYTKDEYYTFHTPGFKIMEEMTEANILITK